MAVEVILQESDASRYASNFEGVRCYFVLIRGVPHSKGLVITDARPLAQAEKIKAKVEAALRAYGEPVPDPEPEKPVLDRFERVGEQFPDE